MNARTDVHIPTRTPFFTPGSSVIAAVALLGGIVLLYRFAFGLGATTNLSDAYPWGLWIAIDVACGVALAAGGFTTAFIVHILHRERYHPLLRPALLTAMIGYTFVALGVATDLGRFWAMWHVMLPTMWQPNSVLFEVAICVMIYVNVLYIEFLPVVCERFMGKVHLPGPLARLDHTVERVLHVLDATLGRVITVFVVLGVVLSCMHQSSLGTLMVIAAGKLDPLWHTPLLPLLFLLSAFAVGLPMVIVESLIASRSFKLPPERTALSSIARIIPWLLFAYLIVKIGDLFFRGVLPRLLEGSTISAFLIAEVAFGVVLPIVIFSIPTLRRSMPWLFAGAALVVLGVVLNRLNVFLIGYSPLDATASYVPAWTEFAVTAGFLAMMVLIYRAVALNFAVIEHLGPSPSKETAAEQLHETKSPSARPAIAPRQPTPRPAPAAYANAQRR